MAVKIIIKRKVPREKEAALVPLLLTLRSKATIQPGYISGETLRNIEDSEEFIVISTWQSVDAWRSWESGKERGEVQERIEEILEGKTEYGIYLYG